MFKLPDTMKESYTEIIKDTSKVKEIEDKLKMFTIEGTQFIDTNPHEATDVEVEAICEANKNTDSRLIDIYEDIENDCLKELGYPPNSMSFEFSIKKGAKSGFVMCYPESNFTQDQITAFANLFLSKLW